MNKMRKRQRELEEPKDRHATLYRPELHENMRACARAALSGSPIASSDAFPLARAGLLPNAGYGRRVRVDLVQIRQFLNEWGEAFEFVLTESTEREEWPNEFE